MIAAVCEFVHLPPDLCMPAFSALCGLLMLWRAYHLLLERVRCDPLTASLV